MTGTVASLKAISRAAITCWSLERPAPTSAASSAFPSLMRLGKQAREDGANESDNVVGDVVEALIGALLIDGGYDAAEKFVASAWEAHLAEQHKAPKHPKSALQELSAARDCKPPVYEVVGRTGAHHQPKFTIRVSVAGLGEATAEGTSKQEAETDAAEALLNKLR